MGVIKAEDVGWGGLLSTEDKYGFIANKYWF